MVGRCTRSTITAALAASRRKLVDVKRAIETVNATLIRAVDTNIINRKQAECLRGLYLVELTRNSLERATVLEGLLNEYRQT